MIRLQLGRDNESQHAYVVDPLKPTFIYKSGFKGSTLHRHVFVIMKIETSRLYCIYISIDIHLRSKGLFQQHVIYLPHNERALSSVPYVHVLSHWALLFYAEDN